MLDEYHHHSASSLSKFLEQRSSWFLQKYRGVEFPGNEHMARGTAVEAGINYWLTHEDEDEPDRTQNGIKEAHGVFVKETIGMTIMPEFRNSINDCIKKGITSVDGYPGKIQALQQKIEVKLDGVHLPIIGYIDWEWPSIVVDNKVTGKTPSALKQSHILQGSLYRAAKNKPVQFHYLVPLAKEVKVKEIDLSDAEFDYGIKLATACAKSIERILNTELDGNLMEAFMFPNPLDIWSKSEADIVLKAWGLKPLSYENP